MKRLLLIVLAATAALWLLAGPGLVGAYLRAWVPDWIQAWGLEADHHFESGWFTSRLLVDWPDGRRAALTGRHLPLGRPGWLGISGHVDTPLDSGPVAVHGHVGLFGDLEIRASAPGMLWRDARRVETSQARMMFVQGTAGEFRLEGETGRLEIADRAGSDVALQDLHFAVDWKPGPDQQGSLDVDVEGRRDGMQVARLEFRIGAIDEVLLFELLAGFEAVQRARPDSFEARMGALAMAGAWQGLVRSGIEIRRAHLSLDRQTAFSAAWRPETGAPEITGSGRIETLLDWLGSLLGVTRGVSPDAGEAEARAWLEFLVDQHWLRPDGERFTFAYRVGDAGTNSRDRNESATKGASE